MNTLLVTFEALFLDCILYPAERKRYEQCGLLRDLRLGLLNGEPVELVDPLKEHTKGCMYHHFGAIYLLRLLVLILLRSGDTDPSRTGGGDSGAIKKKRKASDIEKDPAFSISDGPSFCASEKSNESTNTAQREEREEIYKFSQRVIELLDTHDYFPHLR